MTFTIGTRLGPYEILSAIGAGGMGEVYRARDTKLNRDVALKILPEAFTLDADRIARFRREAQVLASLNHPNIAAIYGFEDSGSTHALVLELVEGPTLADRIAKGPIPLDDALPVAKQIAEALEAAHEQGIIHRDLKPANIKLRHDGTVKVLDFGLAKALEPAYAGGPALTASPTITTPAQMTGVGTILGTAAYMSPEQAKGRSADKRSDIWAFGCVLYEMLTGKRAFAGDDVADTLAAVLRAAPDWLELAGDLPQQVRVLLKGCLEKDPRSRVSDIAVARFLLNEAAFSSPGTMAPESVSRKRGERRRIAAGAAAGVLAGILIAGLTAWWLMSRTTRAPRLVRFSIPLSNQGTASPDRHLAVSPDGTQIVYRGVLNFAQVQTGQTVVRRLDQLEPMPIAVGGAWPFFSPDGRWIGYFSQATGELRKVAVIGGPAVVICRYAGNPRGASWGLDGRIVFATSDTSTGLLVVSENGGEAVPLTKLDAAHGVHHWFPFVLPGARAVLFTIATPNQAIATAQVAVLDLRTGSYRTLVAGTQAVYTGSGHVVYASGGRLLAAGFDPARLEITSDPVPVVDRIMTFGTGAADFAISNDGTLTYVPGSGGIQSGASRSLVWVTRQGAEEPLKVPVRGYTSPRISPDATRVALDIRDSQQGGIWIWDFARETLTALTIDSQGQSQFPSWTPDGKKIIFASGRAGGESNLYWQPADGTGTAERLTTSPHRQFAPFSVSPDGRHVPFVEINKGNDIQLLTLDGKRQAEPLIQTNANEINAEISPDGNFIAYQSDEAGGNQIYVRPFPSVESGKWQVSTTGGAKPTWARSGRELFYLDPDNAMTAVPIQITGASFKPGNPTKLFRGRYYSANNVRTYDVSPDGQKFLMISAASPAGQPSTPDANIVVVLNWFEELKRLVPVK